ncbi:hypothetical protein BURKHO8Y_200067 [Burkholderia sp. 8Y]|nr:hypothetical protein BURKHO8Y_200067 [Burkholderia sp. 8Y]
MQSVVQSRGAGRQLTACARGFIFLRLPVGGDIRRCGQRAARSTERRVTVGRGHRREIGARRGRPFIRCRARRRRGLRARSCGGRAALSRRRRDDVLNRGDALARERARRAERLRALVRFAREPQIQIAEIVVSEGVAGIGLHRRLQRDARVFVAAFLRVERGEIVVRLGQLGVGLREFGERADGFVVAIQAGEHGRPLELRLHVARMTREAGIELRERGVPVLVGNGRVDLRRGISRGGGDLRERRVGQTEAGSHADHGDCGGARKRRGEALAETIGSGPARELQGHARLGVGHLNMGQGMRREETEEPGSSAVNGVQTDCTATRETHERRGRKRSKKHAWQCPLCGRLEVSWAQIRVLYSDPF